MSDLENTLRKVSACGSTRSEVIKFTYKWKIHNFTHCIAQKILTSPKFHIDGYNEGGWHLELIQVDSDFKLALHTNTESKQYFLKCHFFIPDTTETKQLYPDYVDAKIYDFMKELSEEDFLTESLLKERPELCPNDTLTIFCNIDIIKIVNLESQQFCRFSSPIAGDVKSIFESKKCADVTITVGTQNFEAHKAILAARSSVFAAMFDSDMKEKQENKANITDVTADTFEELLRYVYTDEAPKLKTMTTDLLAAADKYEILGLKSMCEESLYESLNTENAAEMLVLADRHNAHQLKNLVLHFIKLHSKDVVATDGYQELRKSHLPLIAEIFEALSRQS